MRRAHDTPWFAVATALALSLVACGEQSINVLAPRDGGADAGPGDDVGPDMGPSDDISVDGGPTEDTRDTSMDLPGAVDGPTTGCLGFGLPCSYAGACCSLACLPGPPGMPSTCGSNPICAVAGQSCGNNADCCSDLCVSAICIGVTSGKCLPAGESCSGDSDCCGSKCGSVDGGATTRCAPLGTCKVLGEICRTQLDCCSGAWALDDRNVQVCVAAPPCGLGGNTCRGQMGDRCGQDAECCTGRCSIGDEGVSRCSSAAACGVECELCDQGPECCSGRCMGDESGYRRCENPPRF
jgi:hypothetical protein